MEPSGRWKLGLALALLTALMWGVLPLFLKSLLRVMDASTLTWYRFLAAAVLLGGFLAQRRRLPPVGVLGRNGWGLMAVAVVGLVGNYVLYVMGLDRVTPSSAQMVIQLAPIFFLLGSLVVFRETFAWIQRLGFLVLSGGLLLFFNNRFQLPVSEQGEYLAGVTIIVVAAVAWAAYALAQKRLLRRMGSEQILLVIYAASVVLLLPLADLGSLFRLTAAQLGLLAFACLNTVVAYGAFAESLAHWEASRVSAVISVTPLLTIGSSWLCSRWFPGLIAYERVNLLSVLGAVLVVVGSAATALGRRRARPIPPPME